MRPVRPPGRSKTSVSSALAAAPAAPVLQITASTPRRRSRNEYAHTSACRDAGFAAATLIGSTTEPRGSGSTPADAVRSSTTVTAAAYTLCGRSNAGPIPGGRNSCAQGHGKRKRNVARESAGGRWQPCRKSGVHWRKPHPPSWRRGAHRSDDPAELRDLKPVTWHPRSGSVAGPVLGLPVASTPACPVAESAGHLVSC